MDKIFRAPQNFQKKFVAPQIFYFFLVAPQNLKKNFVAPQNFQKIFVAPQESSNQIQATFLKKSVLQTKNIFTDLIVITAIQIHTKKYLSRPKMRFRNK